MQIEPAPLCEKHFHFFSRGRLGKLLNLWNFIDVLHTNFDRSSVECVECVCVGVWVRDRCKLDWIFTHSKYLRLVPTQDETLLWYWCAKFSRILSLNKTKSVGLCIIRARSCRISVDLRTLCDPHAVLAQVSDGYSSSGSREVSNWGSSCITQMLLAPQFKQSKVKSLLAMAGSKADSVCWLVAKQKATHAITSSSIPIRICIRIRIRIDIDRLSSRPTRTLPPLTRPGPIMVYFASRDNRDRNGKAKQQVERIIHDEEFGEENVELVDSEWADFEKFIRQLRQRRTSNISMEAELRHVQRHPKVKSQAFYPCPPPAENGPDSDSSDEDDDPFGYIDTLVSEEFLIKEIHIYYAGLVSCLLRW